MTTNTSKLELEWFIALKSYFSVRDTDVSKEMRKFWWDELRKEIVGWDVEPDECSPYASVKAQRIDKELCEAIRYASGLERSSYDGKPDLKELKIWVKLFRRYKAVQRNGYSNKSPEGALLELKATIKRFAEEERWADVWDTICTPNDVDVCGKLLHFAKYNVGFDDAKMRTAKTMLESEFKNKAKIAEKAFSF